MSAILAAQLYEHRNGEEVAPTVVGQFWFRGKIGYMPYAGKVKIMSLAFGERLLAFCAGTPAELALLVGQWWGPVVQTPPWEPDATAVSALVLDAMDRCFDRLVGMFDDDANNMPDQLLADYLTARAWMDAQPVGWLIAQVQPIGGLNDVA